MKSFEDLGVSPELTEALAADGIETPTPLQEAAIPILGKGNNLLLQAGPGAGLLAAWVVPVLGRVEPTEGGPRVLVLCATDDIAEGFAESVARLAQTTGHGIAALGSSWVLPERADILFSTPSALVAALAQSAVSVSDVETLVVDQAQLIESLTSLSDVEEVFDYLPTGGQRVLSALPMTEGVQDLADRHFKRTVTIPAPETTGVPKRGTVRFRIAPEPTEAATLSVVDELLADGARHALVFCRSEDRAADVGDYLTLHGFTAGAPGDNAVPVWLGVDALEARSEAQGVEGLVTISCDAPSDEDTLDRRHSMASDNVVIVLPREIAHLKSLGRRTGYETVPFPPPTRAADAMSQLRETVERAMEEEDTAPYLLALEPLFQQHDPSEVAAAALALLRKKGMSSAPKAATTERTSAAAKAPRTPAWSKLFIGVGERDGLLKGDLLGAITGETGVTGDAVGKIEIRESHSVVEVHDTVARKVIQAINGTTIKGRSVRADFDRPRKGPPKRGRPSRS